MHFVLLGKLCTVGVICSRLSLFIPEQQDKGLTSVCIKRDSFVSLVAVHMAQFRSLSVYTLLYNAF